MEYKHTGIRVLAIIPLLLLVMILQVKNADSESIDETITSRVEKAFFENTRLRDMKIKVETENGVVRLFGIVYSKIDVVRATSIAYQVSGVIRVDADLKVAHAPEEESLKLPNSCSVTGLGWC